MLGVLLVVVLITNGLAADVAVDRATYNAGQEIIVSFTGSGGSTDWIGFFEDGVTPSAGTRTEWAYLDGTRIALTPKVSGSVRFPKGVSGDKTWVVHLFENNGYTPVASTGPFAVGCLAGCSECNSMSLDVSTSGCIQCDASIPFYDNNGPTAGGTCVAATDGCASGYFDSDSNGVIASNTDCSACTTGCAECSAAGLSSPECTACANGYFNDAGTCTACSTQCGTCTAAGNTRPDCAACAEGFYFDDTDTCVACDSACELCNGPGRDLQDDSCLKCNNGGGWFDNNGLGEGGRCVGSSDGCEATVAYDLTPLTGIESDVDCAVFPLTCHDSKSNNDETGIDCGGPECPPCAAGQACVANRDCVSNVCSSGICSSGPACNDGLKNRDESDVDCGGIWCRPCQAGKNCTEDYHCTTQSCVSGVCTPTSTFSTEEKFCMRWSLPSACHFLTVVALTTSETAKDFYQYGKPYAASANTGIEVSSVVQTFFSKDQVLSAYPNMTLVSMFDKAKDGSGGEVTLQVQLSEEIRGEPFDLIVRDDVGDLSGNSYDPPTGTFTPDLNWKWLDCCTDGMTIGPLYPTSSFPSWLITYRFLVLTDGYDPHDEPLTTLKLAFRSVLPSGRGVLQYLPWRSGAEVDFTVEPGECPERPDCSRHGSDCPSCELDPRCSWCGSTQSCVDTACTDCPDTNAECPIVAYCAARADCQSCAVERDCGWCNTTVIPGNVTVGNVTIDANFTGNITGNYSDLPGFCQALYKEEHFSPCSDFFVNVGSCPVDPEPPFVEPNITVDINVTNETQPVPDPIITTEVNDESGNDTLLAVLLSLSVLCLCCVLAAVAYKASKLQEEVAEMVAFSSDKGVTTNKLYQGNEREGVNPLYK